LVEGLGGLQAPGRTCTRVADTVSLNAGGGLLRLDSGVRISVYSFGVGNNEIESKRVERMSKSVCGMLPQESPYIGNEILPRSSLRVASFLYLVVFDPLSAPCSETLPFLGVFSFYHFLGKLWSCVLFLFLA
jgi:hypothetical protein